MYSLNFTLDNKFQCQLLSEIALEEPAFLSDPLKTLSTIQKCLFYQINGKDLTFCLEFLQKHCLIDANQDIKVLAYNLIRCMSLTVEQWLKIVPYIRQDLANPNCELKLAAIRLFNCIPGPIAVKLLRPDITLLKLAQGPVNQSQDTAENITIRAAALQAISTLLLYGDNRIFKTSFNMSCWSLLADRALNDSSPKVLKVVLEAINAVYSDLFYLGRRSTALMDDWCIKPMDNVSELYQTLKIPGASHIYEILSNVFKTLHCGVDFQASDETFQSPFLNTNKHIHILMVKLAPHTLELLERIKLVEPNSRYLFILPIVVHMIYINIKSFYTNFQYRQIHFLTSFQQLISNVVEKHFIPFLSSGDEALIFETATGILNLSCCSHFKACWVVTACEALLNLSSRKWLQSTDYYRILLTVIDSLYMIPLDLIIPMSVLVLKKICGHHCQIITSQPTLLYRLFQNVFLALGFPPSIFEFSPATHSAVQVEHSSGAAPSGADSRNRDNKRQKFPKANYLDSLANFLSSFFEHPWIQTLIDKPQASLSDLVFGTLLKILLEAFSNQMMGNFKLTPFLFLKLDPRLGADNSPPGSEDRSLANQTPKTEKQQQNPTLDQDQDKSVWLQLSIEKWLKILQIAAKSLITSLNWSSYTFTFCGQMYLQLIDYLVQMLNLSPSNVTLVYNLFFALDRNLDPFLLEPIILHFSYVLLKNVPHKLLQKSVDRLWEVLEKRFLSILCATFKSQTLSLSAEHRKTLQNVMSSISCASSAPNSPIIILSQRSSLDITCLLLILMSALVSLSIEQNIDNNKHELVMACLICIYVIHSECLPPTSDALSYFTHLYSCAELPQEFVQSFLKIAPSKFNPGVPSKTKCALSEQIHQHLLQYCNNYSLDISSIPFEHIIHGCTSLQSIPLLPVSYLSIPYHGHLLVSKHFFYYPKNRSTFSDAKYTQHTPQIHGISSVSHLVLLERNFFPFFWPFVDRCPPTSAKPNPSTISSLCSPSDPFSITMFCVPNNKSKRCTLYVKLTNITGSIIPKLSIHAISNGSVKPYFFDYHQKPLFKGPVHPSATIQCQSVYSLTQLSPISFSIRIVIFPFLEKRLPIPYFSPPYHLSLNVVVTPFLLTLDEFIHVWNQLPYSTDALLSLRSVPPDFKPDHLIDSLGRFYIAFCHKSEDLTQLLCSGITWWNQQILFCLSYNHHTCIIHICTRTSSKKDLGTIGAHRLEWHKHLFIDPMDFQQANYSSCFALVDST